MFDILTFYWRTVLSVIRDYEIKSSYYSIYLNRISEKIKLTRKIKYKNMDTGNCDQVIAPVVRRNPSIKRLLKLPWSQGELVSSIICICKLLFYFLNKQYILRKKIILFY